MFVIVFDLSGRQWIVAVMSFQGDGVPVMIYKYNTYNWSRFSLTNRWKWRGPGRPKTVGLGNHKSGLQRFFGNKGRKVKRFSKAFLVSVALRRRTIWSERNIVQEPGSSFSGRRCLFWLRLTLFDNGRSQTTATFLYVEKSPYTLGQAFWIPGMGMARPILKIREWESERIPKIWVWKIWFQIDEDKHIYRTVWKIISRELWPQITFLTIENNNINTFIVNLTFIVHHSLYSSIKSIFLWCFGFAEVHVASMVKGKGKGLDEKFCKKNVFLCQVSAGEQVAVGRQ